MSCSPESYAHLLSSLPKGYDTWASLMSTGPAYVVGVGPGANNCCICGRINELIWAVGIKEVRPSSRWENYFPQLINFTVTPSLVGRLAGVVQGGNFQSQVFRSVQQIDLGCWILFIYICVFTNLLYKFVLQVSTTKTRVCARVAICCKDEND